MRHEMRLAQEPFEKIRNGTKTIESRLYDEKRRAIAVGDEIAFHRNDDETVSVTKKVVALHIYPSFESMMNDLPAERFGWQKSEGALTEIERFYSKEDQTKFGVVGIGLA